MWHAIVAFLVFLGAGTASGWFGDVNNRYHSKVLAGILGGISLIAAVVSAIRLFFWLVGMLGAIIGLVITVGFFALVVIGAYTLFRKVLGRN